MTKNFRAAFHEHVFTVKPPRGGKICCMTKVCIIRKSDFISVPAAIPRRLCAVTDVLKQLLCTHDHTNIKLTFKKKKN